LGAGPVTETLESAPREATHWSTRSIAAHLGMSQSTSRGCGGFGLAPHKVDVWKLLRDPLFLDKVRDVVGLYLDPPEQVLVLCVDEKTSAPRGADGAVRDERPAAGHRSDRSKLEAD